MRARFHRARGRCRSTLPLQKITRPSASLACNSSQTSKASTVPPGKKWPILRVRTTTSTRAVLPGSRRVPATSSGAASLPTSRITAGRALLRFFAHGERGVGLDGVAAAHAWRGLAGVIACPTGRHRENIHGDEARFQELFRGLQLRLVLVGVGDGGVGRGEAVRVHLAVAIAGVVRGDQRHVAIGADLGLGRVVERARALARNAAGLPVVVIVEAAEPAVVVHRHVQVHLVAGGAELGRSRMNGFRKVCLCGSGLRYVRK